MFDSRFCGILLGAQLLILWVVKVLDYTYIHICWFWTALFRISFSDNPFSFYTIIIITKPDLRSWLDLGQLVFFVIIVNGFSPLNIVAGKSISDGTLYASSFSLIILWIYNTKQEQQLTDIYWNIRTSASRWFYYKTTHWNFKYSRVQIENAYYWLTDKQSMSNKCHCAKACVSLLAFI